MGFSTCSELSQATHSHFEILLLHRNVMTVVTAVGIVAVTPSPTKTPPLGIVAVPPGSRANRTAAAAAAAAPPPLLREIRILIPELLPHLLDVPLRRVRRPVRPLRRKFRLDLRQVLLIGAHDLGRLGGQFGLLGGPFSLAAVGVGGADGGAAVEVGGGEVGRVGGRAGAFVAAGGVAGQTGEGRGGVCFVVVVVVVDVVVVAVAVDAERVGGDGGVGGSGGSGGVEEIDGSVGSAEGLGIGAFRWGIGSVVAHLEYNKIYSSKERAVLIEGIEQNLEYLQTRSAENEVAGSYS
mmetsp:Transcript_18743/g.39154  ORF Transcript_18743/g.39154 Transcript_18743/m.39154 type:complete len:294 (+) Transcript_18743:309-1190(+)